MADEFDDEVSAIKSVLKALESLSADARKSVIEYVTKRLGIPLTDEPTALRPTADRLYDRAPDSPPAGGQLHIKDFKEQKNPRSANEMAAVVAYYLAELASADKRKKRINSGDIETYFKIADFPLPEIRFTLPNAKAAGYFNAVGEGEYELNAVGHNLVAHNLPRSSGGKRGTIKKRPKKGIRSSKRS